MYASQENIDRLEADLDFLDFGNFTGYLRTIGAALDKLGRQGDPDPVTGQALNVIEEIGEAVEELDKLGYKFSGSYRRYRGYARRAGSVEDVAGELSDVIISAILMFHRLELDPQTCIAAKLRKIVTRGWVNTEG